jgi:ATP-dependent exoDNAse (exonuclease V) beta subunit
MGARDDDGPRDFAGAKSMAKLLSHRVTPPLAARMAELVQSDLAYCDEADARWRFPALERDGNGPERGKRSLAEWPTAERARAIWQPVVDARAAASERMCRPLVAAVTSASHAELRAATAEQGFEPPADEAQRPRSRGSLGRDRAMAVGSAVHALLEGWDLTAEPDEELARQRSRLPTVLAALGFGEDDAAACSEAEAIVDGFARSELFARFTSLGDRLVARELPVWLAPQADLGSGEAGTPLECISGVIDLVYRDQDGRLVVVDYKTDRLASQDELAARATRYAPQGETYLRAITDGLTLAEVPRFELWFVRDGSIATPLD